MAELNRETKAWNDKAYATHGLSAQRLYPNEELLRFLGRNYFSKVPKEKRAAIRVLEVGCGSCANLWMIAREGFTAYGLDLSEKSLELGSEMLKSWNVKATLTAGDMCSLPYENEFFDVVIDVFSASTLPRVLFRRFLAESKRVLREGGRFFTYTPSAQSQAFIDFAPAKKIDPWTLDRIARKGSPYEGIDHPFRFETPEALTQDLKGASLKPSEINAIGRTYRNGEEYFEFLVAEATKCSDV